jgi:hypothetical protein
MGTFATVSAPVSAALEKPRVPAEYRGLGWLFRDEVQRIDRQMDRALATVAGEQLTEFTGGRAFGT